MRITDFIIGHQNIIFIQNTLRPSYSDKLYRSPLNKFLETSQFYHTFISFYSGVQLETSGSDNLVIFLLKRVFIVPSFS